MTTINHLLNKRRLKLFLPVERVADLNAARGLIHLLGLDRKNIVVGYGLEAKADFVKRALPHHSLIPKLIPPAHCSLIGLNLQILLLIIIKSKQQMILWLGQANQQLKI